MRALLAQVRAEVTMTIERGETLLVTLGIPVFLLVFFSYVHVLPTGQTKPVNFLAPGVLALAVMSTAMVSLGIATGFERSYGVLKRLGTTPLGRPRLLAAKILSVILVEILQVAVIVIVAGLIGWRPHVNVLSAVAAELLATIAFAGLGLLMAGALRAELNLALANGVYVVLLLIGGIMFPVSKLGGFASVARLLPAAALSRLLETSLGGATVPGGALLVLAIWAVAMPVAAAAMWRYE